MLAKLPQLVNGLLESSTGSHFAQFPPAPTEHLLLEFSKGLLDLRRGVKKTGRDSRHLHR